MAPQGPGAGLAAEADAESASGAAVAIRGEDLSWLCLGRELKIADGELAQGPSATAVGGAEALAAKSDGGAAPAAGGGAEEAVTWVDYLPGLPDSQLAVAAAGVVSSGIAWTVCTGPIGGIVGAVASCATYAVMGTNTTVSTTAIPLMIVGPVPGLIGVGSAAVVVGVNKVYGQEVEAAADAAVEAGSGAAEPEAVATTEEPSANEPVTGAEAAVFADEAAAAAEAAAAVPIPTPPMLASRQKEQQAAACCGCSAGLAALLRQWHKRRSLDGAATPTAPAKPAVEATPALAPPRPLPEASGAALRRHTREAPWSPTVLLYEAAPVSTASPSSSSTSPAGSMPSVRAARHVPLNGAGEVAVIDNDDFKGKLVMMHRAPEEGVPCRYRDYFSTRSRRWELRLQGRFKRRPRGQLFVGCELPDFDYSEPLSWFSSWLGTLSLAPLERLVGAALHFTLGDREAAALSEDAEVAQIVGGLSVFDQLVVTAGGEEPPPIGGALDGLGIRRSESADWQQAARDVEGGIDTEHTYTLCFWSASKFIDLIGERLVNLVPLFPSVSLRDYVLGHWPPHFVLYTLPDGDAEGSASTRHPERRKRFLVDLVICNERAAEVTELCTRYAFVDGPEQATFTGNE